MDTRQTFETLNELASIIFQFHERKEKISLLLDRDGLTRMQGIISSIDHDDDVSRTTVKLDDGNVILLKEVIAVNGIFRSDYSEC